MAAGAGISEDTLAGRVRRGRGYGARGWVPTCRWRAITAGAGAGGVASDGLPTTDAGRVGVRDGGGTCPLTLRIDLSS
jgi:hypothetical protein